MRSPITAPLALAGADPTGHSQNTATGAGTDISAAGTVIEKSAEKDKGY